MPEAKGAGVGKMNEGSQKDNSDYKRNKSWGCNVPHGGEKKNKQTILKQGSDSRFEKHF